VDKSVRIHSKKLTSVRIHLTKMCANLLAELARPRDLVCAGLTARLTALSPPVWSKQKSRVSFTYKKWKCQKPDKNVAIWAPQDTSVRERDGERERAKPVYLGVAFSSLKCCLSAKQTKQQKKKSSEKNSFLSVSFVSEKWVKKYNCASNILITILLSVFSGRKPTPPQNDAAAAAVATLRTRHKRGRRGGQQQPPGNRQKHCMSRGRHLKDSSQTRQEMRAAAAAAAGKPAEPLAHIDAELMNCKNSGSPEEKKKSVEMYTIVCVDR
jgi:hypothetical protein